MKSGSVKNTNYVRAWKNLFGNLLAWSSAEVDQWVEASGYATALLNDDDMIYHASPQYWVINSLLQNLPPNGLSKLERVRLGQRLLETFSDSDDFVDGSAVDWPRLRSGIDQVLRQAGMPTLPIQREAESLPGQNGVGRNRASIWSPIAAASADR